MNNQAPPQPGRPMQARRLLPIGPLMLLLLVGGALCVVTTLGFAWLARGVFANRYVTLDDQLILTMRAFSGPLGDRIMWLFTMLGDARVLTLLLGGAAVLLWRRGRWIDALALVLTALGGGVLNQLLKQFYHRARPDLIPWVVPASGYSFPSGHAMGATVCYGMLAFVVWRVMPSRFDRAVVVFNAVLLILLIGLSRVFFGVHFPTDVLGGFVAGTSWLVLMMGALLLAEDRVTRQVKRRTTAIN